MSYSYQNAYESIYAIYSYAMLVAEAEADRYNSQLYESLFLLHRCS